MTEYLSHEVLTAYLSGTEEEVAALCGATRYGTPARPWWYADRGSRLLAVAHLDFIHAAQHAPQYMSIQPTGQNVQPLVFHPALDDRLGAYIIGDFLPRLGIHADVLLTTNEETGNTTARDFRPPDGKTYDWIFQFDRRGTDVVGYKYEDDPLWSKCVRETKLTRGNGSFSDIAALDLGVLGFNFGTGYHDEHTALCYANLNETARMINAFYDFHARFATTPLPFKPDPKPRYYQTGWVSPAGKHWVQGGYVDGKWQNGYYEDDDAPGWAEADNHGQSNGKTNGKGDGAAKHAPSKSPAPQTPTPAPEAPTPAPSPTLTVLPLLTPEQVSKLEAAGLADAGDAVEEPSRSPFEGGTSHLCERCGQRKTPMYWDESDKAYLCSACAAKWLYPSDLIFGQCSICQAEAYLRVYTLRRGEPACTECEQRFYHGGQWQAALGNA